MSLRKRPWCEDRTWRSQEGNLRIASRIVHRCRRAGWRRRTILRSRWAARQQALKQSDAGTNGAQIYTNKRVAYERCSEMNLSFFAQGTEYFPNTKHRTLVCKPRATKVCQVVVNSLQNSWICTPFCCYYLGNAPTLIESHHKRSKSACCAHESRNKYNAAYRQMKCKFSKISQQVGVHFSAVLQHPSSPYKFINQW